MVLPASNRAIVFAGDRKVEVRDLGAPRMVDPNTQQPYHHGVILKVIAAGICGSDLHMYRARMQAPPSTDTLASGHEIFGEVVECGSQVQLLRQGDWVSVPFNVACGFCMNCKKSMPQACLNVNKDMPGGVYGYAMMGGWQGGQAQYVPVPFADFNCLKVDNKAKAAEYLMDLVLLSDVLPTGYNAAMQAQVALGKTVYIAGAGPVGMACAASCFMLGASRVLIGDVNPGRLPAATRLGCDVIDLSTTHDIPAAIRRFLGTPFVDCGIDCVGMESHGMGEAHRDDKANAVLETLIQVIRVGGNLAITGVYLPGDPKAADDATRQGILPISIAQAFMKGLTIQAGQCPAMKYQADLLRMVMSNRFNIARYLGMRLLDWKDVGAAFECFSRGEPIKLVLDPNGMCRQLLQQQQQPGRPGEWAWFDPNETQNMMLDGTTSTTGTTKQGTTSNNTMQGSAGTGRRGL